MTPDASYEERGSDWSHQVSAVGTTRWLQCDQTLPLSVKGVACETSVASSSQAPHCPVFDHLHVLQVIKNWTVGIPGKKVRPPVNAACFRDR